MLTNVEWKKTQEDLLSPKKGQGAIKIGSCLYHNCQGLTYLSFCMLCLVTSMTLGKRLFIFLHLYDVVADQQEFTRYRPVHSLGIGAIAISTRVMINRELLAPFYAGTGLD